MPFDPEVLAPILGTMFVGASTLLLTAAIAWRIGVKPTMRALLEYRTARAGSDPQMLRRLSELEDEVRVLRSQLEALPDGSVSRSLLATPWRPGRERA